MSARANDRLVLVQKQLSIAFKALKSIDHNGRWQAAREELDEIERIKFVQEGRHD